MRQQRVKHLRDDQLEQARQHEHEHEYEHDDYEKKAHPKVQRLLSRPTGGSTREPPSS
jgi:hypothetical protein